MEKCEDEYLPEKKRPIITMVLVCVNILLFLLCTFTGELLYNIGALDGNLVVKQGQYYRLITCMFLHGDVNHLGSNMLFLYFLGEMMEKSLGKIRYGILYFGSGICAGLLSIAYCYLSLNFSQSIGASGAIFGIMGGVLFMVLYHKGRWESISLQRMILAVACSIYYGFTASNVDNAAHIGGLVAGFLLTLLLHKEKKHEN